MELSLEEVKKWEGTYKTFNVVVFSRDKKGLPAKNRIMSVSQCRLHSTFTVSLFQCIYHWWHFSGVNTQRQIHYSPEYGEGIKIYSSIEEAWEYFIELHNKYPYLLTKSYIEAYKKFNRVEEYKRLKNVFPEYLL